MTGTLDIIKLILDRQMNMPENRVWAFNTDVDLPKDKKLFIVLFMREQKPISNTSKYVSTKNGMQEHQFVNTKEEITISLMSKNTSARDRAYEVPMALNSFYSRHLQAQNKMHIAILGEVYDSSFLEETSMFNRWDVRIRVFRSYAKIENIDYFDKFPNTAEFEAEYKFDN